MSSINFSEEQFTQLLKTVQLPPPPVNLVATHSSNIVWKDLPSLELAEPANIDKWFVAFEVKLKAARVIEGKWAEKFDECPKVPQEVKNRLPANVLLDYKLIRLHVLKEYGPLDPVGFFRARLYVVKGTTREFVRRQLEEILTLYNRVAADFSGPLFEKKDLLYPFISAFPPAVSANLKKDMGFALMNDDPFEQLFHRAPVAPSSESEGSDAVLAIIEPEKKRPREEESATENLANVLASILQMQRSNNVDDRPCTRCGNSHERDNCPAINLTCFKCGGPGHFSNRCRKQAGNFARQNNYNETPVGQHRSFRKGAQSRGYR
jgi:hypothetical protein